MEFFQVNRKAFYTIGILAFFVFFYVFFISVPNDFAPGTVVRVKEGMGLRAVSLELKEENIIRSRLLFEAFAILMGGDTHIKRSDYLFDEKLPVFSVARRILKGEHGMPRVVATIPEGFDSSQIAELMSLKLVNFNKDAFLASAKEGYMFPDTYFFLSTDNEEDVLGSLSRNFEKKMEPLRSSITSSGKMEQNIIIMASLIEREAKGDADRETISGILWKRLAIGLPLQVDAAPETYKSKGLPQNAICNPGLEAISAAINPKPTSYLYYLHDKEGNIHYSKSFSEHRANILKYLN